ncbi:hypothetical protein M5C97_09275 [Acidovorax sp. NCPPB 3859]|nr:MULTISPECIES: hypothetical protein [unclassified Acidovorax]MDA8449056.1 hypothetical protein [Acidovorax sp. GBBC 3297]MDA8458856.1 hypothetical protein [Acidovorax sp. GBBC 3333]MDA8463812.1 hypothetical protein [Acidovorax sp. GBBC 3332]MDA8468844.1 hypothetical protein [Acidovorax sp. GBBC 3299]WCM80454.1 hypothetical protein M5C94_09270 [Acidovorax sp. GBBC 712]
MSPMPLFPRPGRPRLPRRSGALLSAVLAAALSAGCAQRPPAPEWEMNARGAADRATQAYLSGNDRVAVQEWRRAREETARTARPDLLARVVLLECATRVASLAQVGCPDFAPLRDGAAAAERAYADYLEGRAGGAEVELLPPAQRAALAGGAAALAGEDPLARLLAAAVLHVRGQGGADVSRHAIDAASSQGWRRPLMAWLLLAEQDARASGDAQRADQLRQRLDVLEKAGAGGAR